jgi:glycosyltransferase involved in cell wall biosynthesis
LKLSKKKITKKIYSKNAIKIINIARFTDQKDHLTLLKAFAIAKKTVNCELILLGYGANEIKIREFIKRHNISSSVRIVKFDINP